mmetsp:Transcript_28675/g.55744  ORF Transcript_28675/g.55744 Transcript_28675/m.55744 type:complete len:274 (-) Transcript_28675:853-1674(-)
MESMVMWRVVTLPKTSASAPCQERKRCRPLPNAITPKSRTQPRRISSVSIKEVGMRRGREGYWRSPGEARLQKRGVDRDVRKAQVGVLSRNGATFSTKSTRGKDQQLSPTRCQTWAKHCRRCQQSPTPTPSAVPSPTPQSQPTSSAENTVRRWRCQKVPKTLLHRHRRHYTSRPHLNLPLQPPHPFHRRTPNRVSKSLGLVATQMLMEALILVSTSGAVATATTSRIPSRGPTMTRCRSGCLVFPSSFPTTTTKSPACSTGRPNHKDCLPFPT